jgi:hypothetical protein
MFFGAVKAGFAVTVTFTPPNRLPYNTGRTYISSGVYCEK